jgi:hypothetical protein
VAADDAEALYGLPLDAFVPERDALAKRLRAEKRRDEADEIKALRKPSVAAWAVNQAVRSQPKVARALWDAGDALVAAQEDLLGGRGDAAGLRAAAEGERAALDALLDAARGLLTSEGRDLGEGTIERVRETLHAAAIDPAAREDVAAGRATRERAHSGLGAFGEVTVRPSAPRSAGAPAATPAQARGADGPDVVTEAKPAKGGKKKGGKAAKGKAAKARATEDPAAQRERAAATREAEREATAAAREEERRRAAAEERERRDAARARADAERELRDARRALEKAQRAADRANERLGEAQAAADETGAALDEARARERDAADALERAAKRD